VLPLIGVDPHSYGVAVKGSETAGGAVSLLFSRKYTKRECVNWFNNSTSTNLFVNYDGGSHEANQTLLRESLRTQKPARCMAQLRDYGGSSKCMAYLADARVVDELGAGHWMLECEMTPENDGICRAWLKELGPTPCLEAHELAQPE